MHTVPFVAYFMAGTQLEAGSDGGSEERFTEHGGIPQGDSSTWRFCVSTICIIYTLTQVKRVNNNVDCDYIYSTVDALTENTYAC